MAIEDSGANVNIATVDLANEAISRGYIMENTPVREQIHTAGTDGKLRILGWLMLGGYIGKLAVSIDASFNVISTSVHQERGLGTDFNINESNTCVLYNDNKVVLKSVKDTADGLYYFNIFYLADQLPTVPLIQANLTTVPQSKQKQQTSHDLSFKVWRLHNGLFHTSLRRICAMLRANTLLGTKNCTVQEIELVMAHQQCPACMMTKANKRTTPIGSGLRPLQVGRIWSEDYQGPFATPAIGGYTGKYTFVEITCGYLIVLLVKSKTELFDCIKKVAEYCKIHGKLFTTLRCDSGTIETSSELRRLCADVNGLGNQGVEIC